MATGKRYYWMKLKESFMTSDTIDYFMSQPDGANYVVLYQMLCLKTINTDGRLSRQIGEIIIPFDVEKIRRDCKWFSADTIRIALKLYESFGLIYEDVDGTLVLSDHKNIVGSETDYSEQKRNQRNNLLPSANGANSVDNVHSDVHENVHTDIRDKISDIRDKEIKSKETEESITTDVVVCRTKDVRRIVEAWNSLGLQQLRSVTSDSTRGGMLRARVNQYGVDGVLEAIEKIKSSEFLNGQNSNGWVITFEWFVKPNNFIKVLEGNYDDRESSRKKGETEKMLNESYAMMTAWGKGE